MNDVDVVRNTRRLWSLVKKYKLLLLLLLGFSFVVETSFVVDKYLFKLLIDGGTGFSQGRIPKAAFLETIWLILGVLVLLVLVRGVGKYLFIHVLNRLDNRLIFDLKQKFFNHIVQLDYNFHSTHKTGSLISKMSRGGRSVETMMDSVAFNFSALVFQLLVSGFALFTVSLAQGAVFVVFVIAYLGFSFSMFHRQLPLIKTANDAEDEEKGDISDIFTNIESVKYYGKEQYIRRRYASRARKTYDALMRQWDMFRIIDALQTVLFTVGAILLVGLPVFALINGRATTGDVAFVYTIYLSMIGPIWGFMFGVRNYYRAMTDFESLYEYEAFRNEIKDRRGAKPLRITNGKIVFENVVFSYREEPFFDRLNLVVQPNTKVALVGRSGAGKSTLVKLLYRFYDVKEGSITIDGTDIRDVPQQSLRSELSIVPQEGVLFDDTIFNNVRFSNPHVSDEEVWEAIRFAQLDRLIASLPDKERTVVGERGVRLSGGERQRVSIARALLANKRILVLDEATSSLDSETEHEIQRDLQELMRGRTSIIIAHRLSTIMSADVIVVIEGGRIVQQGTHEELVRKKGVYRNLWDLQRGGYLT